MALELHVWGPAFGLPSIDAECLAAIALLHHALPKHEWRLVASSDPSISPSNRLPALHHAGVWASGYGAVVEHLARHTARGPDSDLTPSQRADVVAYGAYVSSQVAALLDLSLYATATNWADTTRPAYSAILPFPLTWTVPLMVRSAALSRVEHLGLDELHAELEPDSTLKKGQSAIESAMKHLPTSSRKTVLEELTPQRTVAIRLHALCNDTLAVLEDLRRKDEGPEGKKLRFFSGGSGADATVSSLDCLAFGYLALMHRPELPQDFLREILVSKFPTLCQFIRDMEITCLEAPGELPWVVTPTSALRVGTRFLDDVVQCTPELGEQYSREWRRRAVEQTKGIDRRTVMLASSVLVAGGVLAYGAYVYRAVQPFGLRTHTWIAERQGSRLSQFGDLGAMLDFSLGLEGGPRPSQGVGGLGGHMGAGGPEHRIVDSELGVD